MGVRAGWVCAWAFRDQYPWMWTVHHLLLSKSALVRALWRWIAKFPRVITAVSEQVKAGLTRGGVPETRIEVVPGGIDLERFEKLPRREVMREQFFVPADRPILLCVGRFVRHKGFDVAIQAMERIWECLPDADLWLAGDGPDNTRLVKLAVRCRRPHHVRFFGYWSAVEELYAAADVLLAPARDAGLGLSTMEAIACGLPVVATDIPAMRRLVEHERTGLLVPPEDPHRAGERRAQIAQRPRPRAATGTQCVPDRRAVPHSAHRRADCAPVSEAPVPIAPCYSARCAIVFPSQLSSTCSSSITVSRCTGRPHRRTK
jgi:glycosyltransferase involved in cell wall biosynthesis